MLWEKYKRKASLPKKFSEYLKFWPQQYPAEKMKNGGILFISLNPAFNKYVKTLLTIKSTRDLSDPCIVNCVVEEHRSALSPDKEGKLYSYYEELRKIAIIVKKDINWCNLDLIPIRGSNQSDVIDALKLKLDHKAERNVKEFLQDSTKIATSMIDIINPSVVVVVNGFIRDLIEDCFIDHKHEENCSLVKNLDIVNRKKSRKDNELQIRVRGSYRPLILFKMLSGRHPIKKKEKEVLVQQIKTKIKKAEKFLGQQEEQPSPV